MQATVSPHTSKLGTAEGISPKLQILVFLAGLAIIFARRPDALLNPQFFAEDGKIWFADAYNSGWLATLFKPHAGYLQTFPRLIAGIALLVPLQLAPFLMNACGAAIQVLPAMILLSARCAGWGSLRVRALMAAVYMALPNSREIHVTVTNAQWHLALLACLLLLSAVPRRVLWRIADLTIVILCGLTGPFCFILTPLGIAFYSKRRDRWHFVLACTTAICTLIQILALTLSQPTRFHDPLGASPQLFVRILAANVYLGSLFGHTTPLEMNLAFYAAVVAIATALVGYVFLKASLELRLFLVFSATIFLASIASPITGQHAEPQWWHLRGSLGMRYWFLPTLAFSWCVIWCATSATARRVRNLGICGAAIMCIGIAADWRYPAYKDLQFPGYAQQFAAAAPGTIVTIPLNPVNANNWAVQLVKQ